jgi:DNA-binding MarR family transcriptional regulator
MTEQATPGATSVADSGPALESATAPDAGTNDPDVLMSLFREIGIIHQLAVTRFERVLPHDLTIAQFSLLDHLVRLDEATYGAWSPQRLANAFQVTKGTMSSTLKRAEAKGFVAIDPDPEDGRAKIVRITEQGRAALADVRLAVAPELRDLAARIDAAQLVELTGPLARLRQTLDETR